MISNVDTREQLETSAMQAKSEGCEAKSKGRHQ